MEHRKRGGRARRWKIFIGILLLLLMVRLALPFGIEAYANHQLDQMEEYEGEIGSVSLSLLRGSYQFQDIFIEQTDVDVELPFFTADEVDVSIGWGPLLEGEVVAEVRVVAPRVNFVEGPPEERQVEVEPELREKFDELFPLRIDRLEVERGEIYFSDPHEDPAFDIFVDDIYATVLNLTNIEGAEEGNFASMEVIGRPMHEGYLSMEMQMDPLAETPTFELEFQLTNLPLPELNDFLRAYANFDVHQGTIDAYGELAASEGAFTGYVRPFIQDVEVVRWQDIEEEGLLQTLYEGAVEVAADILESPEHGMIATRIPLEGDLEDPDADIWSAIFVLLRNAFIESLIPGLEHSIGLGDVGS